MVVCKEKERNRVCCREERSIDDGKEILVKFSVVEKSLKKG